MVSVIPFPGGGEKISIRRGEYEVSVLTFGANLHSFSIADHDVVLGYESLDGYKGSTTHVGEVVGPCANRIKDARFVLDGIEYHLDKNDGNNNLHSGSKNFGQEMWEIAGKSDSSVTLSLISPEKGGFPGVHEVMVMYYLSEEGELTIDYSLTSTEKCPFSMTNHAYFNLSGSGDIRKHKLMIPAEKYIATDDELIPTDIVPVENTDFDFRKLTEIGARRNGKYDNAFVLSDDRALVLENDEYRLLMRTSAPAVQLYTGEFFKAEGKVKKNMEMAPFSGLCLESEYFPDFPNRGVFSGSYSIPGLVSKMTTTYKLERK